MKIEELAAYAEEKYHIQEQFKWTDFPGFSVLIDPYTEKWAALLMRQWDTYSGTMIERCDLKCGRQSLYEFKKPYLTPSLRMKGPKWIGVVFDDTTEPEVIFKLFDRAVTSGEQRGFTLVLEAPSTPENHVYRDTKLPFSGNFSRPAKEAVPERLRQMRSLYEYGRESLETKARNFYRQGMFMQDYEDDAPWSEGFQCYFPTYHDLSTNQLRGYFSWRTAIRKGNYQPIVPSAVYLYIYELLNGIGASSPMESLEKLKAFEAGYLDSGLGDKRMRQNLHRWMFEFAMLKNLPAEITQQYADPEMLQKDRALTVLKNPGSYSDEDVFSALCHFGAAKLPESPAVTGEPERGKHLFSETWRIAAERFQKDEKDLFTLCFGERKRRPWHPLANAIVYQPDVPADQDYELNECRTFRCRNGIWHMETYENLFFDHTRFQGFLQETDLKLRRYFKTGRYLKEKPENTWAVPFIELVLEADQKALIEASRPKITIDLSGLDRIRKDAQSTRDSLLTEEERAEMTQSEDLITPAPSVWTETETPVPSDPVIPAENDFSDAPLDAVQMQILRAVMKGESAEELIRAEHLTPALVADIINEALFDDIGDTVLSCEEDRLSLVEDYREDIEQLFGGTDS